MSKIIKMKEIIGFFALSILVACGGGETSQEETGNGEKLFKEKGCTACHTIGGGKLVGPDLVNVLDRRTEDEIIRFVKNPADFGVTLMPPQNDVTDSEIKAILTYVKSKSPQTQKKDEEKINKEESSAAKEIPAEKGDGLNAERENTNEEVEDVVSMVKAGEILFEGTKRFENGGPSCISCHNVDYDHMMQGGLLAPDLTQSYSLLKDGIRGFLSSPPKAMGPAYENNPITEQEKEQLIAFLKDASDKRIYQHHGEKESLFFYFAMVGFMTMLFLIFFLWFRRKKSGVKDDIYNRQIKSI